MDAVRENNLLAALRDVEAFDGSARALAILARESNRIALSSMRSDLKQIKGARRREALAGLHLSTRAANTIFRAARNAGREVSIRFERRPSGPWDLQEIEELSQWVIRDGESRGSTMKGWATVKGCGALTAAEIDVALASARAAAAAGART